MAIPIVAETIINLKFSVGLIIPSLYNIKRDANVPKVKPVAWMTIPGYWASKIADIPPSNRPSSTAYIGAVTGAQDFLKVVTIAKTKPPRPPINVRGMTDAGLPL